jgi:hypothetical protein
VLPKEGPEPYRLLREFGEEGGKSAIVDTAKGAIKKTKARPALPSQELGGDSPGVALMDVVLSWRRAQIWQTQVTHDKQDLEVADDLYDETAAAALKVFYEKELGKKQSGGPAEVPDFAALKDQTKRFYEACIWAILFAARFWTGLVEKHERDRLLSWTTISQEEIPYPARQLQEYWISRFKLLPTFSKGNREDWVNLKFFLRELDQSIALVELIDAAAELLRIPKLKGAKVSLF